MSRESQTTLRFLAAPTDAGQSGSVSAGRVLEWIDKAGYAAAARWSGGYCVTAYVGNVRFRRPVEVGDLVEARARVIVTGRTSMQVTVEVSSGPPTTAELEPATQCLIIFVAVDDAGKPRPVPTLRPATQEERLLQEWAARRSKVRDEVVAAMERVTFTDGGSAPRDQLRFLAAPTDVNWGGKVHGGVVMRWIDEAAHVLVTRWTQDVANVAIFTGGVRFYQPLRIGDLVEVEARLLHTGPHSMHVGVHVRSGDPTTGELALTTYCRTVFVSVDDSPERRAREVPQWTPVTDEDRALDAHATELTRIRERYGD
ncbi:acyl-CoA thioesterase [Ornithinimicrobium panacihumi]|uniref:acyl-CoA thioesterase n=1 Tax=Ornithinimicrobium panacihumi TaxID=2008449 RepID=UPI003F8A2FF3